MKRFIVCLLIAATVLPIVQLSAEAANPFWMTRGRIITANRGGARVFNIKPRSYTYVRPVRVRVRR